MSTNLLYTYGISSKDSTSTQNNIVIPDISSDTVKTDTSTLVSEITADNTDKSIVIENLPMTFNENVLLRYNVGSDNLPDWESKSIPTNDVDYCTNLEFQEESLGTKSPDSDDSHYYAIYKGPTIERSTESARLCVDYSVLPTITVNNKTYAYLEPAEPYSSSAIYKLGFDITGLTNNIFYNKSWVLVIQSSTSSISFPDDEGWQEHLRTSSILGVTDQESLLVTSGYIQYWNNATNKHYAKAWSNLSASSST